MKIIDQYHLWEQPFVGSTVEADSMTQLRVWAYEAYQTIERAGRTCYQSEPKGETKAFIARIVRSEHHSVLEHINFSIRFITDRGVTHELVRHRLAAFSQESTRYCDYSGEVIFIRPVWYETGDKQHGMAEQTWLNAISDAEQYYRTCRGAGWTPQEARSVLPNSLKTEIVMTANLREWRHILRLRTALSAHPQMRALMLPLRQELIEIMPEIFDFDVPRTKERGETK